MSDGGIRLQKALAEAGIASRRAAEQMIRAGRVSVNGSIVTELGCKVDPVRDRLAVDGRPVEPRPALVYFMLNKPAGVITTAKDTHGRPTVLELMPASVPRVFPVGRLDADTEGLLLLTNDGELANLLLHPRHHVPKTYVAEVRGSPSAAAVERLRAGVLLDDGWTAPAEVRVLRSDPGRSVLELVLREGRKRQVRRMLAQVGHPVEHLRRIAFGPLTLGDLPSGKVRSLLAREVEALRQAAGLQS